MELLDLNKTFFLIKACSKHNKSVEIAKLLIEKGADVHAANSNGLTPFLLGKKAIVLILFLINRNFFLKLNKLET